MSKTFSLTSVAALIASTLFADMATKSQSNNPCMCLEQGLGLNTAPKCYSAAYNAPASISVRNGWDFNLFASFIYWHTSQESMETAAIAPVLADPTNTSTHAMVEPSFQYKPGFKVGFGFDTNYDDWTGWVEYTWLHQSTHHTSTAIVDAPFTVSQWFTTGISSSEVHSKWKMHLDLLDAAFSRPYYEGTQITIAPYAGMRGLWVRQQFNVTVPTNATGTEFRLSKNKSHSWAVGPMLGTMGHWMLGMGFRFEGKAGGSILYTQYTHLRNYQQTTLTTTTASSRSFHDYNVLRPTAELGVGLGWGSYFDNQNYYWDLSARYDFNVLWDQNVMARFVNNLSGINGTTGNLYLHGLTLSSRFDF